MLDKLAGYKTQIRSLEKKLKEMDHTKLNPSKVKELTEAIQNLKNIVKEKEDKRVERKKKKDEAAKAAPAAEVEKEAAPEPKIDKNPHVIVPDSLKKHDEVVETVEQNPKVAPHIISSVEKFAIDSKVEPIRGTPGSWGVIIREAGTNGDPLCYVKWMEGNLKTAHGDYGAYYPTDLKLKAEVVTEAKDPTAYVPREQLYNLEADYHGKMSAMIKDLEEEIKTAYDKGEAVWAARLEQKLADAKKALGESSEKKSDAALHCDNCGSDMGPLDEQHLENLPDGGQKWKCNKKKASSPNCPECGVASKVVISDANPEDALLRCTKCNFTFNGYDVEKHAEDENGSGGTNKLKVYDLNPAYDKDPQEKSTGYGGDRAYGWQTCPNGQGNELPLEGADHSKCEDKSGTSHAGPMIPFHHGSDKPSMYCDKHIPSEKKASLESDKEIAFEKAVDRLDKKLMNHELSQKEYDTQYEELKKQHKVSSLKFADLDLNSIEKRWALYVDGKLALRTLTRTKADRVAKERFPDQLAAGKVEIKREDYKHASLDKQAINVTVEEKLFVVNPLGKTAEDEYHYDVNLADGSKLFKITSKDEMGEEHLAYVIEKELTKEASRPVTHKSAGEGVMGKVTVCKKFVNTGTQVSNKWADVTCKECLSKKKASLAKLTSNLAFLKKGSFVSILDVDTKKKQVKFASLDGSLKGWAPLNKFAAYGDIKQNFMPHENHQDEIFAESGNELLVSCPAGSTDISWRAVEAPPATPESLNEIESSKRCKTCGKPSKRDYCSGCERLKEVSESNRPEGYDTPVSKEARGCDQCEATMINGVFCHETGCPNKRKEREQEDMEMESAKKAPHTKECNDANDRHVGPTEVCICDDKKASLNVEAHIRHEDGKWVIYSHDYKKKLGEYDSKEEATKRLREIEYFKSHKGSLQPLSKKEAVQKEALENQPCDEPGCNEPAVQYGHGGVWCAKHKKSSNKKADVMDTKCEECGEPLGPEAFLSKWPVCGKCTKKRHEKAVGKKAALCSRCGHESGKSGKRVSDEVYDYLCEECRKDLKEQTGHEIKLKKKADPDISLEQQVQGFKDRMSAVNERLATPPVKQADLETAQDLTNVDVKDLSSAILHTIDLLESKIGENVSADPELHPMLEDLENKVYEIEMKLGIKPNLPEHEKAEPEHAEIKKEIEQKEEPVEKEADSVQQPPSTTLPPNQRWMWEPQTQKWVITAVPEGTSGTSTY